MPTQPIQPMKLRPMDVYNQSLVDRVHPRDWVNPIPAGRYNLVVLGAGAGGLVTAMGAAGLGARVALVERHLMGGDCLNTGCVPSKALIRSARAAADARRAGQFGVITGEVTVDFPAVMERMRQLRAEIAQADAAARLRDAGVDVFLGTGTFTGPDRLRVGEQDLRFHKAVVATGGRPWVPPIDGLAEAGFLTNEQVFELTQLPGRLAVIGGGPIGCELAQAFQRLGAQVSLVEGEAGILPREDPDAAQIVQDSLVRDGVDLILGATVSSVRVDGGDKVLTVGDHQIRVDKILVAVGRRPNVEGLGLEQAGVAFDIRKGVTVDDTLRSSNPKIYAVGDVALPVQFTHTADASARIAIENAIFPTSARLSALTIPWATFTDPELAHVGLYGHQAQARGIELDTYEQSMAHVDRAILDRETEGFVRIHTRRGSDEILGATVVGPHAGDLISELTVAMVGGVGLGTVAKAIHPYPTMAEGIKRAADAYSRTRLTPAVAALMGRWLAWSW